jgi:hypothetical protein
MSLRFAATLLQVTLLCAISFGAEPATIPDKFGAVIGGFLGSTYAIELRDGALRYTKKGATSVGYGVTSATVSPTPQQWREFRKSIDELNLWQWKPSYPNQGVADGTQWSLEIVYRDRALKTGGSNSYPDTQGRANGEPRRTETFGRYLAAIEKLIGQRTFE